jgi:hypothetical protein
MIGGFPVPPSRDAFGPMLEDYGVVTNPRRQIGADTFNLAWRTLASCGQLVPKAWVFVSAAGVRGASAECWNPNADPTLRPVTARTSTGIFTVTFQPTYPDGDGNQQAVGLFSARPCAQGPTTNLVATAAIAANVVTVKITVGNTGALADAPFDLEVR